MINSLLNQPRPQAPTQTRGSRRNQGTAQQIKAPGDEAGILPKVVSALFTTLNRGGGRQSLFMFNFVILAGMVSRVWSKIVAAQDLSFECLTIRPANAMHLCKSTICSSSGHTFWGQTRREKVFYIFSLWCFSCYIKNFYDWHFLRSDVWMTLHSFWIHQRALDLIGVYPKRHHRYGILQHFNWAQRKTTRMWSSISHEYNFLRWYLRI